jgi:hypothetical protein
MQPANIPAAIIALSKTFIVRLLCFIRCIHCDRHGSAPAGAKPASACRRRAYIQ